MANTVNVINTDTFEEWRVKTNEIGSALGDLDNINSNAQTGEDTVVATLNNLRTESTNNAGWIGDISTLFDGYGNVVEALNNAHSDLSTIAAVANIDIDSASVSNYNGTETAWIDILNSHYARLNTKDTEIGTIANIHDGNDIVTSINGLDTRLDAAEIDIGTWSNYNGTAADITTALNEVKTRQDNLTSDFLDASGDTVTGDLNFTSGGVQATGQYLNLGVGGTDTIRINTSNRVGIGKAAHTSYKVDVSGTLNATDLKIGGESLDNRYLEVNEIGGVDEVDAAVTFNSDVIIGDKITLGSKVIYDSAGDGFDEVVQDIAGNMFEGNSESGGIYAGYSDVTGKITLGISDNGHNHSWSNITNATEQVQDIVGAMVSSNTESGIQVVYQDADGTLDFNVNDPTITLSGDVTGSATMSNLGSVVINTDIGERVQDIVGAMVAGNTESGISVTYQDADGTLDFNVNDPTITLSGDVAGSATMSNLGNVTINASVTNDAVELGTNTTGNYVQRGDTSGNGISGSVNTESGVFTVSSNATQNNTANTIVYRDSLGNFSAGVMTGTATTARYADLAENYRADKEYEVGTVMSFGGSWEVTQSDKKVDTRIAGVISTAPAYLMNSEQPGDNVVPIALMGRVPCKVQGDIKRGDMLVSAGNGRARVVEQPLMGSVIGKALEDSEGDNVIEVVVGKL